MPEPIIAELDALHAAATPGEWRAIGGDVAAPDKVLISIGGSFYGPLRENAAYIAAAHNHWPEVRALLTEAQAAVQWRKDVELQIRASLARVDDPERARPLVEAVVPLVAELDDARAELERLAEDVRTLLGHACCGCEVHEWGHETDCPIPAIRAKYERS